MRSAHRLDPAAYTLMEWAHGEERRSMFRTFTYRIPNNPHISSGVERFPVNL